MIQDAGPRDGRDLHDHLARYQTPLTLVPPGKSYTAVAGGWAGMSRHPGIEPAFTDAGVHWLRAADGTLSDIISAPADYYKLTPPLSWVTPSDEPRPVYRSKVDR